MDKLEELHKLAKEVTPETIDQVMDYVGTLPGYYQIMFVRYATRYDPYIINTKRLGEWCNKIAPIMVELIDCEKR